MLGVLWYLQRRLTKGTGAASRRRRGEGIQVLSRQGIGAKAQVVVVEVEGTRYVLGVTENGVSVIDRARAQTPDERAGSELVASFEQLLAEAAAQPAAHPVAPAEPAPAAETPAAPLRRDRRSAAPASDPLRGSILSPATWQQTAQALGLRR